MKLIIQIPCYNEVEFLAETFESLPRVIPGIHEIEVLIIDDGSSDGTCALARELGVHHIIHFPRNRGLSAAYMSGIRVCMRLGADIVVNTDADNQYKADDIEKLVQPILERKADIVVGDRKTDKIVHFSPVKRLLQRWGSCFVRMISGTRVQDSTSGFRAMNRKALSLLFVHNSFTYTLETIIQAGKLGLSVENVPVRTNDKTRDSRLFKSIPDYLRRNGPVILRAYGMYSPAKTFSYISLVVFVFGSGFIGRFFYYYLQDPSTSSHVQSLQLGVGMIVVAFIVVLMAFIGDLLASNRRLMEEILSRVRELDAAASSDTLPPDELESTNMAPWLSSRIDNVSG